MHSVAGFQEAGLSKVNSSTQTALLTVDDEDDRAGNLGHQHYFQPNLAKGGLISKTFSHSLT